MEPAPALGSSLSLLTGIESKQCFPNKQHKLAEKLFLSLSVVPSPDIYGHPGKGQTKNKKKWVQYHVSD